VGRLSSSFSTVIITDTFIIAGLYTGRECTQAGEVVV